MSATWAPVLADAIAGIPPRAVRVRTRVSTSFADWQRGGGNSVLFPVRLRALGATDCEAQLHTAHAAAVDLAAHCSYFAKLFDQDPSSGCFKDTRELGERGGSCALLLGLQLPQELLHAVVQSVYSGSIALGPNSVEQVLMVAQYLGMPALLDACSTYLIQGVFGADGRASAGGRQERAAVQLARLAGQYCGWMMPALLDRLRDLSWESGALAAALRALSLEQCLELLQGRVSAAAGGGGGLACQTQLLDCIKGAGAKRTQLLQRLLDFKGMHQEELYAVRRYATALLLAAGGQRCCGLAGQQQQQQQQQQDAISHEGEGGCSSGAACCGDGFWHAVLVAACAHMEAELQPPAGLHLFTIDAVDIWAGAWALSRASLAADLHVCSCMHATLRWHQFGIVIYDLRTEAWPPSRVCPQQWHRS
jgi:hypothetical protein